MQHVLRSRGVGGEANITEWWWNSLLAKSRVCNPSLPFLDADKFVCQTTFLTHSLSTSHLDVRPSLFTFNKSCLSALIKQLPLSKSKTPDRHFTYFVAAYTKCLSDDPALQEGSNPFGTLKRSPAPLVILAGRTSHQQHLDSIRGMDPSTSLHGLTGKTQWIRCDKNIYLLTFLHLVVRHRHIYVALSETMKFFWIWTQE